MVSRSKARSPRMKSPSPTFGGRQQPRRIAWRVLHVSVEEQHVAERLGWHYGQAAPDRSPLAALVGCRSTSAPAAAATRAVSSVEPSSTTMTWWTNGLIHPGRLRRSVVPRYRRR